jgi:parallel beta-helix repeat protein
MRVAVIAVTLTLLSTLAPAGDEIAITEDFNLAPGIHTTALRIVADGVTVNLGTAVLDGGTFEGRGISIEGRKNVTIRGGSVRGYKIAIRARDCEGLRIEGVDVSGNFRQHLRSTPEREDTRDWLWPHENDELQWETRYGAGISLTECPGALVSGCRARRGQNGLLLTRCDRARVASNDFSFLSGWGLAMWRSSRCLVTRNRFDWCVRGYSHGVYDRGQDSTGILVFEQCCDNVFAYNSATHGGDGFFLYAGHETTKKTGTGGCHGNVLYRNDFSHAVANGIEATFSERNLFIENRLDDCNYGVWAGYSRQTTVRGNVARGCTIAGVAIEHGQDNRIEDNVFEDCRTGVQLWWDEDPGLTGGIYGRHQETTSARTLVKGNRITGARIGVSLATTTSTRVVDNEILDARVALRLRGDCGDLVFRGNAVQADASPNLVNATGGNLTLGPNLWLSPLAVEGDDVTMREGPPVRPASARWRPLPDEAPFLAKDARRGRDRIIVDDRGPYDFREPRLWPAEIEGGTNAVLNLLGPDLPFEVVSTDGSLVVTPMSGRAPARLRVSCPAQGPSIREGTVKVKVGEHSLTARVRLTTATWTVRYFAWKIDPREDAEAYRTLISGEPLDVLTLPELDLRWQGGRPTAKVPANGFATTAETTLSLPAGAFEIVTVSDDGVRVFVDGKRVLENWTHHGPTEDRATVMLERGEHRIRVEHFELDGWAVLSLRIRLVVDD